MADESRFTTRREEAQPQVVIRRIRAQQERGIAIVQLAREPLHVLGGQRVGIEHHAGRIAGEAARGERIDLEHAHAVAHDLAPATGDCNGLAGSAACNRPSFLR